MADHLTCHSWMHPIWSLSHIYFRFVQIVSNSIFLFRCRNFVFPLSFLTSLSALISSKAIFFLDFCVCVLVILFNFFWGSPGPASVYFLLFKLRQLSSQPSQPPATISCCLANWDVPVLCLGKDVKISQLSRAPCMSVQLID